MSHTKTDRVLSGMRPTGRLHIGNYRGAAVQFRELQDSGKDCFFFVADLHALNELDGPEDIDAASIEVVRSYMACGIDPDKVYLYRQSHIPEISEVTQLLGNFATLAQLRRCTTAKGKVDDLAIAEMVKRKDAPDKDAATALVKAKNPSYGSLTDLDLLLLGNTLTAGLYLYPVLMAADILAVRSTLVPVGADQRQHVEFARDYARTFNHMFQRDVLTVPELTEDSSVTVPGIDGSLKMSKSAKNSIALLDTPAEIRKKIGRMPTQAEPVGPRDTGTDNLYQMVELFCETELADEFLARWGNPADKYFGEMKTKLAARLTELLEPIRIAHAKISDDDVRDVLARGASHVQPVAAEVLHDMKVAIGLEK